MSFGNNVDKGLLATIKATINESEEDKAYKAHLEHQKAYKKALAIHDLLKEIHAHMDNADSHFSDDEHACHTNECRAHLRNAEEALTNASGAMGLAHLKASRSVGD